MSNTQKKEERRIKKCQVPQCPYPHKKDGSPILTMPKTPLKRKKKVKVKAWAIYHPKKEMFVNDVTELPAWQKSRYKVIPIEISFSK